MKPLITLISMLPIFCFSIAAHGDESTGPQCSSIEDCAQKAMEAAYQAKVALQIAVPRGAVIAFNLEECPDGWADFPGLSGRVIIGSGQGVDLSDRTVGEKGGQEKQTLNIDQLPAHTHQYRSTSNGSQYDTRDLVGTGKQRFGELGVKSTSSTGEGKEFDVMPPFYALKYCVRQ